MTRWGKIALTAGLAFNVFIFVGVYSVSAQTIPFPTPTEVSDFTNNVNPLVLVIVMLVLVTLGNTIADYRIRMRGFAAQDKDRDLALRQLEVQSRQIEVQSQATIALVDKSKRVDEMKLAFENHSQKVAQLIETVIPAMASEKKDADLARAERDNIYNLYRTQFDNVVPMMSRLNENIVKLTTALSSGASTANVGSQKIENAEVDINIHTTDGV